MASFYPPTINPADYQPKSLDATKMVTGVARFSYLHILEPQQPLNDSDVAKYSVSLIIPKEDTATIQMIEKKIEAALKNGAAKFKGGKIPPKGQLRLPLRDGDMDRDDPVYAGCYFMNATCRETARHIPEIVDHRGMSLTQPQDVYSGMYGRASINFWVYDTAGNKGVSCGLNHLQKLADGEALGGQVTSAADDFGFAADDFSDDDLML